VNSPFGKAFVILNRRAGKGARRPDEFEKVLSGAELDFDLHVTERRHHAVELARQAVDDGWTYLVAVGGDGTIHEVVNGMMGTDGHRRPPQPGGGTRCRLGRFGSRLRPDLRPPG